MTDLNKAVAKIAGLKEGVDFGYGDKEHDWSHLNDVKCPDYSHSLDLIVPVVRQVNDPHQRRLTRDIAEAKLEDADVLGYKTALYRLLFTVDNPAKLLCEALVESVGGENG